MVLANIAWLRMMASAMHAPENNINAMPSPHIARVSLGFTLLFNNFNDM
jgi:hypothetical protein